MTTPVYGLEYLVEGEPARNTRAKLQRNAETIEAALIAGGLAAPGASDLLEVSGRVSVLEDLVGGSLADAEANMVPLATELEAAAASAAYNGRFQCWPVDGPVTVAVGADVYGPGGWRLVSHAGGPSAVVSKADGIKGGVKLVITYTGSGQYLYLRQLVPELMAFSRGRWSWTHDVENDIAVGVDYYVQARINSNDWDRVRVMDSGGPGGAGWVVMAPGRRRVATTFSVPDLESSATMTIGDGGANLPAPVTTKAWAENNYLESAIRFVGQGSGTVTVIVRDSVLAPGRKARGPLHVNPTIEETKVEGYHEVGSYQQVGYTTTAGQKRFSIPFRTKKARSVAAANIRVWDAQGTADKITTYDGSGVATHGVTPPAFGAWTAGVADGFRDGFAITIGNTSTISGIGLSYEVKLY